MTWMLDALCRTRPSDWWDLGDDGNRLALGICSVCPSLRPCADAAGVPVGVVRAGVAYGDDGPLPVCGCGRPTPDALRSVCLRCDPPVVEPSREQPVRPTREKRIAALHASGVSLGNIAIEFGMPRSTVFAVVKRQRAA